jgi:5-keto-L-gluconate epimerase
MKLSYAISFQETKFDAIGSGPFEEALDRLQILGYNGVEIAVRNPAALKVSKLIDSLASRNLQLSAIGTGQAYVDEGLSFASTDKAVRREAIQRMKRHSELAREFGSIVIIGLIRGSLHSGSGCDKQREAVISAMSEVCEAAMTGDVKLAIEPINRYESNLLNTADETLDLIETLQCPNLGVLLDTFHMNIEEKDIKAAISRTGNRLMHFHIADSNRRYPGMGHLDFVGIIQTLNTIGYEGYLSGELLPEPDLSTAMKQYIHVIKEVMDGKTVDGNKR